MKPPNYVLFKPRRGPGRRYGLQQHVLPERQLLEPGCTIVAHEEHGRRDAHRPRQGQWLARRNGCQAIELVPALGNRSYKPTRAIRFSGSPSRPRATTVFGSSTTRAACTSATRPTRRDAEWRARRWFRGGVPAAAALDGADLLYRGAREQRPVGVAFWIPYQDITQHNHTAQWTWKPNPPPPPPPDGGPPRACAR